MRNAQTLMQDKENDLDSAKKQLEGKLEETEAKEKFLDEKARQVNSRKHLSLLGPIVFSQRNEKKICQYKFYMYQFVTHYIGNRRGNRILVCRSCLCICLGGA